MAAVAVVTAAAATTAATTTITLATAYPTPTDRWLVSTPPPSSLYRFPRLRQQLPRCTAPLWYSVYRTLCIIPHDGLLPLSRTRGSVRCGRREIYSLMLVASFDRRGVAVGIALGGRGGFCIWRAFPGGDFCRVSSAFGCHDGPTRRAK